MLENNYNQLNSHEKVLLMQVAANPGFMQLLKIQKEEIEQQLKNFWARENESDSSYRRRNELLNLKLQFVDEHIDLFKNLLKKEN